MSAAMKSVNQNVHDIKTAAGRWSWIYNLSGTAALLASGVFLGTAFVFVINRLAPSALGGRVLPFGSNWLLVLLELHGGVDGAQSSQLQGLNLPDTLNLALVAAAYPGLYAALRKSSRFWAMVAVAQALLAPVPFITTASAGRSGVIGAGLVSSALMLRSSGFGRVPALAGIVAGTLLLLSDLSVGVVHSKAIAGLTAIGYALLVAWLVWIAARLWQLGQKTTEP